MHPISSNKISMHERSVYNQYLITTRSVKNKPWKARTNFDNFPEDKLAPCKAISKKLLKYPHINIKDFFYAPFFEDKDTHVSLDFYATPKAMNSYIKYMKHLESLSPDDTESLIRTSRSFLFIRDYIKNNNLTLTEYFNLKEGNQYKCLLHLMERKTWVNALISFPEFNKIILNCDKDITKLMCGDDFFDKIDFARAKCLNSSKYNKLIKQIKTKLKIT